MPGSAGGGGKVGGAGRQPQGGGGPLPRLALIGQFRPVGFGDGVSIENSNEDV